MSEIITLKNLNKTFKVKRKNSFFRDIFIPDYREVFAVKDLSLSISEGESVAFLGANGAGKTTTIKMLSGLIYPSGGDISVMGYTPFDRKRDFLKNIGLVMGNKSGMNWDLTANQSFELNKHIYGINDSDFNKKIEYLTKMLDVKDLLNIQIRRLSLGERMKMELIGAIIHNPKILFLDEPSIGLDLVSKRKIREFLREIQKEYSVTMLLTSHDMSDVEKVCDRVVIIKSGEKIYDDQLNNLKNIYDDFKYIKFIFHKRPKLKNLKWEIVEEGENHYLFKVLLKDSKALISYFLQNHDILDIDIESVSLDEIIERYI